MEIRLYSLVKADKNAHTFSFHILSHWLTNADNRKWLHTAIFLVARINLWCQKCGTYGF